jgi:hypothetical protein
MLFSHWLDCIALTLKANRDVLVLQRKGYKNQITSKGIFKKYVIIIMNVGLRSTWTQLAES